MICTVKGKKAIQMDFTQDPEYGDGSARCGGPEEHTSPESVYKYMVMENTQNV